MTSAPRILVIGSGFGGAIAAARLAEAGMAVTVVERGPWRDSLPARAMGIESRAPFPVGARLWTMVLRSLRTRFGTLTLNRRGLLEFYTSGSLNIINASGVGGGSHAYGGLNLRPPGPGYWDAVGLSDAGMARHYQCVEERMGTAVPDAALMRNSVGKLLAGSPVLSDDDAAAALPMGMLFPSDSDTATTVNWRGLPRRTAGPGRDGTFGSPGGTKTSLDFAYLYPAMRDHGLRVLDLTQAIDIRPADGGGYCVSLRDLRNGRVNTLTADAVFVAAGTLNTLELLLRSRAAGGLQGMERLGEGFYANGDLAFTCKLPAGSSGAGPGCRQPHPVPAIRH